jgi:hypothetical protein
MLFTSRLRDNTLNSSSHLQELVPHQPGQGSKRRRYSFIYISQLEHGPDTSMGMLLRSGQIFTIYNRAGSRQRIAKKVFEKTTTNTWWLHLLSVRFYLAFEKQNFNQNSSDFNALPDLIGFLSVLKYTVC